jgi:Zn-finger nucleic acid-binding protein
MRCPGCAAEMNQGQPCATTAELCPSCGSCWITRNSMQAAIESIERRSTAGALATLRAECAERRRAMLASPAVSGVFYRKCPDCGVQMHRKAFSPLSSIVADVCAVHGFFLGAGQLEAIREYVARGGEILALEAAHQELAAHLSDLKRKVTDLERARAHTAGGVDMFFVG